MNGLDMREEALRLVARTRRDLPPEVDHGPTLAAAAVIIATVRADRLATGTAT